MGKIYCMLGKSSSGKDTIYKMLLEDGELALKKVVPYTTRPMRSGETDGVEYYFCDEARLAELQSAGLVVELRSYNTVHGVWNYFTVKDHQLEDQNQDYLTIGTLESYLDIRDYFGKERVIPIYIEVEDGTRLQRALDRERGQQEPKYEELCRRFLADAADFSEDKLEEAGITTRFVNENLKETVQNIKKYMLK